MTCSERDEGKTHHDEVITLTDKWMEESMDGWMEEWMNEQKDK